MQALNSPSATSGSYLEITRRGLSAMQFATTAAQLRRAVESMHAVPGVAWPELPRNESLLAAAREQQELVRLQELDSDTGLPNRRHLARALRAASASTIALLIVRLGAASKLRELVSAAHVCVARLRPGDLAARVGPRRLAVLVHGVSHASALAIADRLLADLLDVQPSAAGGRPTVLTISRERQTDRSAAPKNTLELR